VQVFVTGTLHYDYYKRTGITPTPAIKFGSLVHAMVLGATRAFVVYPEARRGNKWKQFQAEHEGVEIVTAAEWQRASDAAFAVRSHHEAGPLFQGTKEHTLEWTIAGRSCRGTPDVNGKNLVDLKVTDANPAKFPWHARRMGWHCQLAWYRDGLAECGTVPEQVCIVAVEPKAPHAVTVFDLTEAMLDLGRKQYRLLIERLNVCEESNYWPSYVEGIALFDVTEADEDFSLLIDGEEVTV